MFGLLGVNGAGKTTTFKMMLGLERATRGRIYILNKLVNGDAGDGDDVDNAGGSITDEIDYRRIWYCPQFDTPLLDTLTTIENLSLYGKLKTGDQFSRYHMFELLRSLDLTPYANVK